MLSWQNSDISLRNYVSSNFCCKSGEFQLNVQATAVYLACDDQSSYMTGAVMNLTGGNPHIG